MSSITVALVGMFVVFCALVIIIVGISIYSRIVRGSGTKKDHVKMSPSSKNNNSGSPTIVSPAPTIKEGTDTELIAVITAAIMAGMERPNTNLVVKSIKRVGHTTPIWNVAGRNEYILSKL